MNLLNGLTNSQLEEIVLESSSMVELVNRLGFSNYQYGRKLIIARCKLANLAYPRYSKGFIARTSKLSFLERLTENSDMAGPAVKEGVLKRNLIPYSCSFCDNRGRWRETKLVLHLDHINGIKNDHRLENLRFLCPNCHSQTSTYCKGTRTNIMERFLNR